MIVIETDRLIFRRLTREDMPFVESLWTDGETMKFMGGPREAEAVRRAIERSLATTEPREIDQWTAVDRNSGRLVGDCGLVEKEIAGSAEVELVYIIAEPFRGNGYATEAAVGITEYYFGLGRKRLVALIDPGNRASERVALKAGFRFERPVLRPNGAEKLLFVASRA